MGIVSQPLRQLRQPQQGKLPQQGLPPDAPPPVDNSSMMKALVLRQHQKAALGRVLVAEGLASEDQVQDTLSRQYRMPRADLSGQMANSRLLACKPARFWLRHCAVPWMQLGRTVTVAVAHPDRFETLQQELRDSFQQVTPVLASEAQITALLTAHFSPALVQQASCSVAPQLSCRTLRLARGRALLATLAAPALFLSWHAPAAVFTSLSALALLSVFLFTALKLCGLASYWHARAHRVSTKPELATPPRTSCPMISILIPLYQEAEISRALLTRIRKLSYPRAQTDVILVLEEHDSVTRAALQNARLPAWIRVVEVPAFGGLTTKPRAMNYSLNFCRGDIIGVWDAEDAPQAEQLNQVAQAFAAADKRTACFQGVLDYYNPGTNWISRCFTLEYASWFRIVLHGIARLGLVVPLGGTTMFVRRKVLEELGGWDAHNVTEDADLGVRLYRAGYRTEMLPSTTYEEANWRPWPWIKQRSRWLKGFMVTYLVHMRQPLRLLAELGWKRFLGFQAFFLGTIGQFLFAPVLWSFWLFTLGLPHPSDESLPPLLLTLAAAMLVFFEGLGLVISITAAFAMGRPWLAAWAPAMILYFPMGAVAVAKAAHELLARPFFWDKTAHGIKPATKRRRRRWRVIPARWRPASAGS
ncbi:glycosyl transferase [Leisingera sp. ANG1]|uniref:glycosyltransferase n=2 Tax=Leisingera TaxID=191028 RepID=UPI0002FDF61D|nr:glycosyltransferase [Leisingera sp. ANG-S]KIC26122.1 glycosyl transferase [Leisingera sp. ANG-S3]KIC55072.1 glycosyl transferase [Leisingera sp. ANG-S]KID08412.1 glycosyl transferase [Leisingera sp. ANG1]